MNIRRLNWLNETRNQEIDRRLTAVESAIQDLQQRFNDLQNAHNILAAKVNGVTRMEYPDDVERRAGP